MEHATNCFLRSVFSLPAQDLRIPSVFVKLVAPISHPYKTAPCIISIKRLGLKCLPAKYKEGSNIGRHEYDLTACFWSYVDTVLRVCFFCCAIFMPGIAESILRTLEQLGNTALYFACRLVAGPEFRIKIQVSYNTNWMVCGFPA